MRRLLALLLLAPSPAFAQAVSTASQSSQNNNNQAVAQPVNNQANQSRSQSVGGGIFNTQVNNSQGDLGEMSIGARGVSCQSPSFYANAGVVPQDAYGFYDFSNNRREMMYNPQAQVGVQLPFGPQVAACVDAMKHQATQIKVATETGTIKKCIEVKTVATKAEVTMAAISKDFPVLSKRCAGIWGI